MAWPTAPTPGEDKREKKGRKEGGRCRGKEHGDTEQQVRGRETSKKRDRQANGGGDGETGRSERLKRFRGTQ
ncbi:hypothetical protein KM043_016177 [Ampulex compressa]|nr:hypothetical protein KM043_016177 [Ampulex compressa]